MVEVGPDTDDSDSEEEKEEGSSVGVEEGSGGWFKEDMEWGNHGSDDEKGCGDGASGKDGDLDVEPKGEGNWPQERVPVLERVEDGVAEKAESNDEGGFLVGGEPTIGDNDDGDAYWNEQEEGMKSNTV